MKVQIISEIKSTRSIKLMGQHYLTNKCLVLKKTLIEKQNCFNYVGQNFFVNIDIEIICTPYDGLYEFSKQIVVFHR